MASWYVENLLRGSQAIKDGVIRSENDITDVDMNSDLYSDLLSVEKTLGELLDKKLIKPFDEKVVNLLMTGLSIEEVSEKLNIARPTVTKKFSAVCDRIAFVLGDNFSDLGYVNYMKEKYNLTEEQVIKALEYMKSSTKRVVINYK